MALDSLTIAQQGIQAEAVLIALQGLLDTGFVPSPPPPPPPVLTPGSGAGGSWMYEPPTRKHRRKKRREVLEWQEDDRIALMFVDKFMKELANDQS